MRRNRHGRWPRPQIRPPRGLRKRSDRERFLSRTPASASREERQNKVRHEPQYRQGRSGAAWGTDLSTLANAGAWTHDELDRGEPASARNQADLDFTKVSVDEPSKLGLPVQPSLKRRSYLNPKSSRSLASSKRQDAFQGSKSRRSLTSTLSLKRMPVWTTLARKMRGNSALGAVSICQQCENWR